MARANKPGPTDRARYVFGWMLALGADAGRWVVRCPVCLDDMTVWTLAGVAGRPARYITLFHTVPYAICQTYSPDVLRPACDRCNGLAGDTTYDGDRWPEAVRGDTRVTTGDARRWNGQVRAEADRAEAERRTRLERLEA